MKFLCINCNYHKSRSLINFGRISFTGKFPKKNQNIKKAPINLVMCKNCKLVQLKDKFNQSYLFNNDYGYRTGINETMRSHVKDIVKIASSLVKLKRNDYVLDIASNDATLLNFYPATVIKFGIDPIINKYIKEYQKINFFVADFFSKKNIQKLTYKKFKIITALAVFYDLHKPNNFLNDIENILEDNGILILEFTDLYSILKKNMFDAFCHEHIGYYSTKILNEICQKNNLRIFDLSQNEINGCTTTFFICKKSALFKQKNSLKQLLKIEKIKKLDNIKTYQNFFYNIKKLQKNLNLKLKEIKKKNKTIHGYGASTKGNVLLQYFKISNKTVSFIAERNSLKFGLYTPGSKIKIISEAASRKLNPDYFLVLPWHFKDEILKREKKLISQGTKFIFPLPKLEIFF